MKVSPTLRIIHPNRCQPSHMLGLPVPAPAGEANGNAETATEAEVSMPMSVMSTGDLYMILCHCAQVLWVEWHVVGIVGFFDTCDSHFSGSSEQTQQVWLIRGWWASPRWCFANLLAECGFPKIWRFLMPWIQDFLVGNFGGENPLLRLVFTCLHFNDTPKSQI